MTYILEYTTRYRADTVTAAIECGDNVQSAVNFLTMVQESLPSVIHGRVVARGVMARPVAEFSRIEGGHVI